MTTKRSNGLLNFWQNKKSFVKFGKLSLVLLAVFLFGYFFVNFVFPVLANTSTFSNTTPANNSYINGTATQVFSVQVTNAMNITNGTLSYKRVSDPPVYTIVNMTNCNGLNPICSTTADFSSVSTYPDGTAVEYYFTIFDNTSTATFLYPLYVTIDRTSPQWTGNVTSPSTGATYSSGATYWFNITITDTGSGVRNVTLQFNGANYTAAKDGSVYYNTFADLGVGSFNYKWFMNDSTNGTNLNSTSLFTYTIVKATPTLSITPNVTTPVNYPTASSFAGSGCPTSGAASLTCTLFRGNSSVTKTGTTADAALLGAGVYVYNYSTLGNANYTAASAANSTLEVLQGTPSLSITDNVTSPVTYPTASSIAGSGCPTTDGIGPTCTLYRGNSSVTKTGTTADAALLGAGVYVYNYSTPGNANWTAASATNYTLGVLQGNANVVLAPSTQSITYPASTLQYCTSSGTVGAICKLYVNDLDNTTVNNTVVQWGVGTYTYVANVTDTANYTNTQATSTLTVAAGILNLTLSGSGVTYPTAVDVIPSQSNNAFGADVNYTLWRGNDLISSAIASTPTADTAQLAAGTYNYVFNATGGANWTANVTGATLSVVVGKGTQTLIITPNVTSPITYPTASSMVGSGCTFSTGFGSDVTCTLYRGNSSVTATGNNAADSILLGAGTYAYGYSSSGGANWTATSATNSTLTVSKGTATLSLTASPSWTPVDVTVSTVTCTGSSLFTEALVNLYKNGLNVNSTENAIASVRPAGTYTFDCNNTATANYSASSTSQVMTVTGTTGAISGYVYLSNSSYVPNSTVQVSDGTHTVSTNTAGYYQITGLSAGTYTLTVSGVGYWPNSSSVAVTTGATTTKIMYVRGSENYNVTIPGSITSGNVNGFWQPTTWYDFKLSTQILSNSGVASSQMNITNVTSSITGKFTIIYRYNSTSNSWVSFVPGASSNDLTTVASSDDTYWIFVNNTDRIEIGPRYA